MSKLYSLTGTASVSSPEYGQIDADDEGGFDLPTDLADRLYSTHVGGKAAWETESERQQRLVQEELKRRSDPATLLAAVEKLQSQQKLEGLSPDNTDGNRSTVPHDDEHHERTIHAGSDARPSREPASEGEALQAGSDADPTRPVDVGPNPDDVKLAGSEAEVVKGTSPQEKGPHKKHTVRKKD